MTQIQQYVPGTEVALPVGATVSHGARHHESMRGRTGRHWLIGFPNGYQLSVVHAYGTYGVEMGLIGPDGRMSDAVFETDTVEGWATPERLAEVIGLVNAL